MEFPAFFCQPVGVGMSVALVDVAVCDSPQKLLGLIGRFTRVDGCRENGRRRGWASKVQVAGSEQAFFFFAELDWFSHGLLQANL